MLSVSVSFPIRWKREDLQLLLELNTGLDERCARTSKLQGRFVDMGMTMTGQVFEKSLEGFFFRWYCESLKKATCLYSVLVLTVNLRRGVNVGRVPGFLGCKRERSWCLIIDLDFEPFGNLVHSGRSSQAREVSSLLALQRIRFLKFLRKKLC